MSISLVLPENDIPCIITAFEKYAKRAERRLHQIKDHLQCEICYDGYKSCEYQCKHHIVCKICYSKIHLCPFCRAPQVGVYPDMWYYDGDDSFTLITEDLIRNGLNESFNDRDPSDYARWFNSACVSGISDLNLFQKSGLSVRIILRMVADCLNKRANFPIFAWQHQKHLHFDADRWRLIQDAIVAKTRAESVIEVELRRQLRQSLSRLLRKIKEVSDKAGLTYRTP